MSEVLKQPALAGTPEINLKAGRLSSYLPAAVALLGAGALALLRYQAGPGPFRSDGGLMLMALAAYLIAAVFYLTNLYAPSRLFEKIGIVSATLGVMLNFGSWLVRWIAYREHDVAIWLQQGKPEAEWPWIFRNIPFANLYDLSLGFAFGAGITTLLIAHRRNFRFLGAVSLPLASLILILARFIGDDITGLQPVLDSYWRPIHVGIAALSYGIALVCFATAVVYLLKDGVKTEAMAAWASVFALAVIATVSKGSVLAVGSIFWGLSGGVGSYGSAVFLPPRIPLPLRAELPYVGWLLFASGILLAGVIALFLRYLYGGDERSRRLGHHVLKAALITQALAVGVLVYQVKTVQNVVVCEDGAARAAGTACVYPSQFQRTGAFIAEQQGLRPEQVAAVPADSLIREGGDFIRGRQNEFFLSLNANPVELAALITAFAGTLFVILFSFRTEKLRAALPDKEKIDSLMYKTGGVTFAGLALLLMTGAVWANESWGRYWGWDSKETGAFVAWLTYGGFLHVRISRGWTGRASAYFAIVAFLLIVFTYLGVSYLLPGLHSSLVTAFMTRENFLFTVVGLLLGYVIAFHLVVYYNQSNAAQTAASAAASAEGLPADHPTGGGPDAAEHERLLAAAEEAGRAAREKPQDFDAQMKAADTYFEAGSFEDAIDFMTRANRLRPDDYKTVVRLGTVYSSAGRFEDAARWYTAALAKKPDDCDARSELALTYFMRTPSQPDKAVAELRRSLEINPNHVPSLHNLTLMLLETKQFAESASVLARLEQADPTYAQLPRLRGEIERARVAATPDAGAQKKSPTD